MFGTLILRAVIYASPGSALHLLRLWIRAGATVVFGYLLLQSPTHWVVIG
jgi:hypothetical protein